MSLAWTVSPDPPDPIHGCWGPASCLPLPTADLLAPTQVILVVKYWTLLFVGTVVVSLSSYVIFTSLTESLLLYRISPKTFPFLCELPLVVGRKGVVRVVGWLRGGERGPHSPTVCLTPSR